MQQFFTLAAETGINAIVSSDAQVCRLMASTGPMDGVCIVIELAAPRHGCGSLPDAYWAHTTDIDLFAGSHGPSLNLARIEPKELVAEVSRFLDARFGARRVRIQLVFQPFPNYELKIPNLQGDSDSGQFAPMQTPVAL